MRWVRIRAEFPRYAGGGPSPTFDITSDDDGVVNVEIAVRPEGLAAPVAATPPTFFSSVAGSAELGIPATEVRLRSGRATYALPDALWSSLVERTETVYFRAVASTSATGAPVVASHGDDDCLRGFAGQLEVLQMSAPVPAEPLSIPAAALALVPEKHRRTLNGIIGVAGTEDRRLLAELAAHQVFVEASTEQQAGVLDLFARTDSPGRALVEHLLDLGVQVGSNLVEPGLFARDECNEGTTLDHLLALHDAHFHRRVRARRAQIVREAIRELVDPGLEINQGNAGTCTVTSVTAYAAARNPAEVARWMRHLFDGASRFRCRLARGGFLRLNTRAFSATSFNAAGDAADFFARSYTERVLQAALMDFGNFRQRYDPKTDNFIDWAGAVAGSGLWYFEVTRILENVFNQPFRWEYGGGTSDAPNQQAAADRLVSHLQNDGLPALLATSWGAGKAGGHAVLAVRAEGSDVVFRNPQYRGSFPSAPDGTALIDPPRRILHAERAEEVITQADLRAWIIGYCAESGSVADFGYPTAEIPLHLQKTVPPTAA